MKTCSLSAHPPRGNVAVLASPVCAAPGEPQHDLPEPSDTHFQDDFRRQIASQVALFPQPFTARKLPDGPNGPNFVENTTLAVAI